MHHLRTRVLLTAVVSLGSLCLMGCPQRTSIERIKRDPGRFAGKEVTIAGQVTNSLGAMGTGAFEVDDGTGRIWVYSERYGIPGRTAKLAVTGRVEEGFSFGGRNFAVLLRETRPRHY